VRFAALGDSNLEALTKIGRTVGTITVVLYYQLHFTKNLLQVQY